MKRILFYDDTPEVFHTLMQILNGHPVLRDFEIVGTMDGEQVIRHLSERYFDAFLCDYGQGLNVPELADILKPGIRIIVFSGVEEPRVEDKEAFGRISNYVWLTKPIHPEAIFKALLDALGDVV